MFNLKSLHHFTFLLVGAVLLAGAVDPKPVAAQDEDSCVDCLTFYCNPDPDDLSECHTAVTPVHNDGYYKRKDGVHPRVPYPKGCTEKHPPGCRGGGIDGILYDAGVLKTVLAAVSAGDALEVYRIIRGQPEKSPFYFATERMAIQVRGCTQGTVAVHIPLRHLATPEFLAAVAAGAGSHLAP
ncbi:hypothetical protein [Candidatus Palauibacter sp.]|uniref:hypothetical protein n=1 Tax=Candidatus Palauibacter sp. TaxID=3101350 RepID=UPI003C6EE6DC